MSKSFVMGLVFACLALSSNPKSVGHTSSQSQEGAIVLPSALSTAFMGEVGEHDACDVVANVHNVPIKCGNDTKMQHCYSCNDHAGHTCVTKCQPSVSVCAGQPPAADTCP